ncbi:unnamed protein product [Rhodiola kirilowii]
MLSSSSYVLILIIILAADSTAAVEQRFKEAPKFYNAEHCHVGKSEPVHIAMTLDANYLRGSLAAVFSILQHALCPENIHFNFITATNGGCDVRGIVSTTFPYLSFETYTIDLDSIASFVSNSIRSALDSPLNYARIYLAKILPTTISKVVYLDSDLILVDDIAHLAATEFQNDVVLAAPEYCNANFTSYFTPSFWANPTLSLTFSARKACYFNTGVMVIDLRKWRSGDYTRRMEEWMELQKRMRIYELGSLPPFLLVFAGDVAPVDHRWNQHGLGGDNYRGLCRDLHPGKVSLLHWSGKGKPWARIETGCACPLDALWAPYDLLDTKSKDAIHS